MKYELFLIKRVELISTDLYAMYRWSRPREREVFGANGVSSGR